MRIMPCSSARALLTSCRIETQLEVGTLRQISIIRTQRDGRRCSSCWKTGTTVDPRRCSLSSHFPRHWKTISIHFPSSSTVIHLQLTVISFTTPHRYSCYKKSQRKSVLGKATNQFTGTHARSVVSLLLTESMVLGSTHSNRFGLLERSCRIRSSTALSSKLWRA